MLASSSLAYAGEVRGTRNIPVAIEDVVSAQYFGNFSPVRFSPDSKWLSYVVIDNRRRRPGSGDTWARTGVPPWGSGADIYVVNVASGFATNVTLGQGDNWLPSWSPDSRLLAFYSDRDGSGQAKLWVWDTASNTLKQITDLLMRGQQIEWTRAGQQVIVTAAPEGDLLRESSKKRASPSETEPEPEIEPEPEAEAESEPEPEQTVEELAA